MVVVFQHVHKMRFSILRRANVRTATVVAQAVQARDHPIVLRAQALEVFCEVAVAAKRNVLEARASFKGWVSAFRTSSSFLQHRVQRREPYLL